MITIFKSISAVVVVAFAMLAALAPVAAQSAIGTVMVSVRYCPALAAPAELPGDPGDACIPGPAQFTFYLVGDGTNSFESLTIDASGLGSISLPVGEYEVIEENSQVVMRVFVEDGATASLVFGFPGEAQPETPSGTLIVGTFACTGVESVSVIGKAGNDCVRTAKSLSFYLVGDSSNGFFAVDTNSAESTVVTLPVGDYEVVDEGTQTHLAVSVTEGTNGVDIGYPATSAPTAPAPTATVAPAATSPVTGLPITGSGPNASMSMLVVSIAGAVLLSSAVGIRLRKSR